MNHYYRTHFLVILVLMVARCGADPTDGPLSPAAQDSTALAPVVDTGRKEVLAVRVATRFSAWNSEIEPVLQAADGDYLRNRSYSKSKMAAGELAAIQKKIIDELYATRLFKKIIPYNPHLVEKYKPAMLLTLYGSWFSREMPGFRARYRIPGRGANASERSVQGPGLTTRFEVQSIASGQQLVQWNSFCNVEGDQSPTKKLAEPLLEAKHRGNKSNTEELAEPLLEAKHRAALKKLVDNYDIIRGIGHQKDPNSMNNGKKN